MAGGISCPGQALPSPGGDIAQPTVWSHSPGPGMGEGAAGPAYRVTRAGPAALWARGWEMAVEIESPGHPEACPLPYAQELWCYGKNARPRASLLVFPVAKTPQSQCRGPRFNPWSGNLILHATTKSLQVTTQLKISHATTEAHVPQLRPNTAK